MNDAQEVTHARISSIDIIRGAVMVLMAIDHVRVYAGIPAGGPSFGIFFTRWITHYCAPVFVFLAGTSAFLYGQRHEGLTKFLLTRGLWLIFLELTFLRIAWTFNFDFASYEMAGVIWVIGWSMILLSILSKLPLWAVGAVGMIMIAGHNVLDSYFSMIVSNLGNDVDSALWKILYVGFFAGPISFGPNGPNLIVLYSMIPWVGVMAVGYAFGAVLKLEPSRRNQICLRVGFASIVSFIILRLFNLYGDPVPWKFPSAKDEMPAVLSFLNTTKYPASLLFLLMTLGPAITLIPWLEQSRSAIVQRIALFGRIPFFYYVLHIPLIHALALVVSYLRFGNLSDWLFANHPMGNPRPPAGYMWELWQLYLVWAIVIVMLYYACRWFVAVKSGRTDWWLKYL